MSDNLLDNIAYTNSTLIVSGNAVQVGDGAAGSKSVVFTNNNGAGNLAWGPTANRTISLPDAGGVILLSSQGILSLSAGGNAITSGQAIFSNSNGVSFGANGQTITASHNGITSQTNQTVGLYALGNTTQNSSTTLDARSLSLSGSGNITVGYSNGSIIIGQTGGGGQSNQSIGFYGVGNTTQSSSTTLDARTVSFNGLGAMSVGYSNGSIQLSAPVASSLSATGIVSIQSNGSTISIGASQSNQSIGFYGLGNTTQNSSTTLDAESVSFNGLGDITVGYSNGSVQISGTQTNQTVGLYALGNTTQNSSTTRDARSLSFNGLGIITAGYSNGSIQISATTAAQTNQTVGVYGVGNTTGQSSSSTVDARSLSFNGAGIASVGMSGGSVVISVPAAGAQVNFSAGTTSGNLGSVVFSNSNGVSFGLNGSTITASAAGGGGGATLTLFATGNTTQNSSTTFNQSSVLFNALGAMTMGYSNGSVQVSAPPVSSLVGTGGISLSSNGSTITIGIAPLNILEPYPMLTSNGTTFLPGLASLYFQPFLAEPINSGRINIINAFSVSLQASSTTNFVSNITGSRGASYNFSRTMALYSQGSGTNSTRLESLWSNTWTMGVTQTVSVSTFGATSIAATNAATLSYVASVGTNGSYTTSSTTLSGSNSSSQSSMNSSAVSSILTSMQNMISGTMMVPIGFNTSISAGNYWMMMAHSTGSTTAQTAASFITFANQSVIYGLSTHPRLFGQTAASSGSQMIPGQGVFSAASASPPSTVAFTDIRSVASNLIYYFNIMNSNA